MEMITSRIEVELRAAAAAADRESLQSTLINQYDCPLQRYAKIPPLSCMQLQEVGCDSPAMFGAIDELLRNGFPAAFNSRLFDRSIRGARLGYFASDEGRTLLHSAAGRCRLVTCGG
jgi:hypothetical protein